MILYKLTIGYILDLLFGDPYWLYHPIRVIGKIISVGGEAAAKVISENRTGRAGRRRCFGGCHSRVKLFYQLFYIKGVRPHTSYFGIRGGNLLDLPDFGGKMSANGSYEGISCSGCSQFAKSAPDDFLSGWQRYKKAGSGRGH